MAVASSSHSDRDLLYWERSEKIKQNTPPRVSPRVNWTLVDNAVSVIYMYHSDDTDIDK